MARVLKFLAALSIPTVLALGVGFYRFAMSIEATATMPERQAEGIVVLTGTEERITAGLDLLMAGNGHRLLISGVNTLHRTPEQLLRRLGEATDAGRCCVEIGHSATNTVGNARETAAWARKWGFRRLIIVTSSHHMPRSLAEFSRTMPSVELIAHPVPSRLVRSPSWWTDRQSARVVIGEYLKYVVASARISAESLVEAFEPELVSRKVSNTSG